VNIFGIREHLVDSGSFPYFVSGRGRDSSLLKELGNAAQAVVLQVTVINKANNFCFLLIDVAKTSAC